MTEDLAGGPPRGALEADADPGARGGDRSGLGPHRRLLGRVTRSCAKPSASSTRRAGTG